MVELGHFVACVSFTTRVTDIKVEYGLVETREITKTFEGFACRSRKRLVRVASISTGSTDTLYSEEEVLLTLVIVGIWSIPVNAETIQCAKKEMCGSKKVRRK